GRGRCRPPEHGQPEAHERGEQAATILVGTLGQDRAAPAERPQCAAGIVRAAADANLPRDAVARDVADDGHGAHACSAASRAIRARTSTAAAAPRTVTPRPPLSGIAAAAAT